MKQFFEICKVDEETRMVWGYASTESVDSQGETVTKDAMRNAWDDYMQFGNIREMHTSSAVGVVKEYDFDDVGVQIGAHIVDDMAWKKVVEGVYKGFSIGGKKLPGGYDMLTKTITALKLTEISLVDRPANPEALITMWKADNLETEPMGAKTENPSVAKLAEMLTKGDISPERLVTLAEQDINKGAEPGAATVATEDIGAVPSNETGGQPAAEVATEETAETVSGDNNKSTGTLEQDATEKSDSSVHLTKVRGAIAAMAIGKGADAEEIKKGMWGVMDFASLIQSLYWLQQDAAWEAEAEGDGSTVPAQIAAGVRTLCGLLVQMVQEEAGELVANMGADVDPVIVLGEMVKQSAAGEHLGKFNDAVDILKAGARNSSADLERIQKAHDLMAELGATCDSELSEKLHKASHDGDIAKALGNFEKVAGELATLRKAFDSLSTDHEELKKRFASAPTPPKGALLVVAKGEDVTEAQAAEEIEPVLKNDGTVDEVATEIKKLYASGGRPLARG